MQESLLTNQDRGLAQATANHDISFDSYRSGINSSRSGNKVSCCRQTGGFVLAFFSALSKSGLWIAASVYANPFKKTETDFAHGITDEVWDGILGAQLFVLIFAQLTATYALKKGDQRSQRISGEDDRSCSKKLTVVLGEMIVLLSCVLKGGLTGQALWTFVFDMLGEPTDYVAYHDWFWPAAIGIGLFQAVGSSGVQCAGYVANGVMMPKVFNCIVYIQPFTMIQVASLMVTFLYAYSVAVASQALFAMISESIFFMTFSIVCALNVMTVWPMINEAWWHKLKRGLYPEGDAHYSAAPLRPRSKRHGCGEFQYRMTDEKHLFGYDLVRFATLLKACESGFANMVLLKTRLLPAWGLYDEDTQFGLDFDTTWDKIAVIAIVCSIMSVSAGLNFYYDFYVNKKATHKRSDVRRSDLDSRVGCYRGYARFCSLFACCSTKPRAHDQAPFDLGRGTVSVRR